MDFLNPMNRKRRALVSSYGYMKGMKKALKERFAEAITMDACMLMFDDRAHCILNPLKDVLRLQH